jgi:DNA-binding CsgD family transcriptional regulator
MKANLQEQLMKKRPDITLEQVEAGVLDLIRTGHKPTYRVIARKHGGSHATIQQHLKELRRLGRLPPGTSRVEQLVWALQSSNSKLDLLMDALNAILLNNNGRSSIERHLGPVRHLLVTPPPLSEEILALRKALQSSVTKVEA